DKVLSKEPLRFQDEFVRHKILDIIGDLALLGRPLKAHIVAVRPGHALNNKLARKIKERLDQRVVRSSDGGVNRPESPSPERKPSVKVLAPTEVELPIRRILDILPHAYPFVMIDRVIEFVSDDELRAIKNVTINEPYFVGHF